MERTVHARLFLILTAFAIGCGGRDARTNAGDSTPSSGGGVDLTGAGATFPQPLYNKWFHDYGTETGVRINYQAIGSGGGIRQLSEGTVDFGASDAPMSDAEMASAKGGPVMHIPTVIGAVAITYNLSDVSTPLKLTGAVLGDIYLGRITKWNDSRIAALNIGVTLPARDILVVRRTDGSGTTYVFTDYLSAVSSAWRAGPGKGKDVQWPVGLGGKGNEGVAGQVKQTPGAIGYVELAYAKQNRLPVVAIQNAAGNYMIPSVETATAAAAGISDQLDATSDYRVSIVNAPGANAYPISSFTWLLVYRNQPDAEKARKLADFLRWAMTKGGGSAAQLDYAPLPDVMTSRLTARIDSIAPASGT
jgi:phosphate transport system substrate-binding protein